MNMSETENASSPAPAEESAAPAAERPKKKAAAPRKRTPREPKPPARLKIVCAVGDPGHPPVATFPYAERAAADAECAKRGKNCMVKPIKVSME